MFGLASLKVERHRQRQGRGAGRVFQEIEEWRFYRGNRELQRPWSSGNHEDSQERRDWKLTDWECCEAHSLTGRDVRHSSVERSWGGGLEKMSEGRVGSWSRNRAGGLDSQNSAQFVAPPGNSLAHTRTLSPL